MAVVHIVLFVLLFISTSNAAAITPSATNKELMKSLIDHIMSKKGDYQNKDAKIPNMRQEMEYGTAMVTKILRNMFHEYFTGGFTHDPPKQNPLFPVEANFYALASGSYGRHELVGSSDVDVMLVAIVANTHEINTKAALKNLHKEFEDYWTELRKVPTHLTGTGLEFDRHPEYHVYPTENAFYTAIKTYRSGGPAYMNTRISEFINTFPIYIKRSVNQPANYQRLYHGFIHSLDADILKNRFNSHIDEHIKEGMKTNNWDPTTDMFRPKNHLLRGVTLSIESFYTLRWKETTYPKGYYTTSTIDRLYQLAAWGDITIDEALLGEDILLIASKWYTDIGIETSGYFRSKTHTLHHDNPATLPWLKSHKSNIRAQLTKLNEFGTKLRANFKAKYP
eukprot:376809_1